MFLNDYNIKMCSILLRNPLRYLVEQYDSNGTPSIVHPSRLDGVAHGKPPVKDE